MDISNNLEELNGVMRGNKGGVGMDAKTLLEKLGFTISDPGDISFNVTLPAGWTVKNEGSFHTVFHGPNGEEVWSFIKYDPWDRHSFLQARNVKV